MNAQDVYDFYCQGLSKQEGIKLVGLLIGRLNDQGAFSVTAAQWEENKETELERKAAA